jgi:bifunctional non-homologous end joining protein LigD
MAKAPPPRATTDHHPARRHGPARTRPDPPPPPGRLVPRALETAIVRVGDREVTLTNLRKPFWPDLGITKGDLIQYYVDVSTVLLPHLRDRAMVMKRYPNGAAGDFFFMKRAPSPRPAWIALCSIEHASGNVIDFPMIQDLPSLLWVVNLGCIDLNQWYARCDDVDRPDYLHFDLDPGKRATFDQVLESARILHRTLDDLGMPSHAKTTGSRGLHVYVPIVRGPTQKQVWSVSKTIAVELSAAHPRLMTAEYRLDKRPTDRVLVDYNQNAWGRTLASVYSVRPTPRASVSTPVTWGEVDRGIRIEDFRLDNVPARVRRRGDLWAPLLAPEGRFDLARIAGLAPPPRGTRLARRERS